MSLFSRKVLLLAALAVILTNEIKPAEALRCYQCAGYDRVENQCSPKNDGESKECSGPDPVCELIEETYPKDSILHGQTYILRKCGQEPNVTTLSIFCGEQEEIASTLVTRCYCNTKANCNKFNIKNKGGSMNDLAVYPTESDLWEFLLAKNETNSSSTPLKCWECNGYDRVANQCSPNNQGKLVECKGANPVCELVEERDTRFRLSTHVYISRKCGNLANSSAAIETSGTCDSVVTRGLNNITRCYCNNWDECNFGGVSGIGETKGNSLIFAEEERLQRAETMQFYRAFVRLFRNNEMAPLLPKSCQELLTADSNSEESLTNVIIVCLRRLTYDRLDYLSLQ